MKLGGLTLGLLGLFMLPAVPELARELEIAFRSNSNVLKALHKCK